MIESRCGILCSECDFRETMHCKGCLQIEHPFWGNCPVKNCVETGSLPHCGLCTDFPCVLAKQFAYDEKQGDQGKRLTQCEKWKESVKG